MSERERKLEEENARLRVEIKLLKEKIDLLVRKIYGSSSEKIDPNQLLLLEEEKGKKEEASACESSPVEAKGPKGRKAKSKPRLPENLPVEMIVIEPQEVKADRGNWRCMGEEISEQLDYHPGRFVRQITIRRKFVPKDHPYHAPVVAPLPERLQERLVATPRLIAAIVVAKYCDHLPLYRQQQQFWSRHRVWLPRHTLSRWVGLSAEWLEPIYRQMHRELFEGTNHLQMDETPVRYLQPGIGHAPQGYLWAYGREEKDILFAWHPTRSASCITNIIPCDFKGVLQSDAYQAYNTFARRHPEEIVLAGCWSHLRRNFYQAQGLAKIDWVLKQIALLYQIEKRLQKQRAGPRLKAARRSCWSKIIVDRLYRTWMRWKINRVFLPQSNAGKAIDYALNNQKAMRVYLENGQVAIDNNLIENAIRPTAIGKKNWLFFGSEQTGQRSAILYTIIEACRRREIDPYAYLVETLEKLPNATNWQVKELTPKVWAKTRPITSLQAVA